MKDPKELRGMYFDNGYRFGITYGGHTVSCDVKERYNISVYEMLLLVRELFK